MIAALAVLLLTLWASVADAACRQALALGLDVSGSVDAEDYALQIQGLAGALTHPEVRAALLTMPSAPVALAVFEWSGPEDQRLTLDWTDITDADALADVAARLRSAARASGDPSTALGSALRYGGGLLRQRGACWKRTLDLSGDGKSNTGPRPQDSHDALPDAVTVNALVIGAPARADQISPGIGELSAYFRAYVIHGPDAFVETALGFEDFEAAMVRKLKRELQGQLFSRR
ncbi:DUF1194 domain-containing protein [Thalassococcus sp. BH17M4-6]|uniref:DUF1194 domain-containing protein n=1 Tax=Thalassococcus sp. BH17M4-6 TaxID=3413148 RepID=UPI003BCABC17